MHNNENHFAVCWRGVPLAAVISILFSVACLSVNGLAGDLDYWRTWVQQILNGGLSAVNANYPPLFLEWLWVVAKFYQYFEVSPVVGNLLKAWAVIPVLWAQLFILLLVARMLADAGQVVIRSPVFWLTAFNPVFILDGPIWGQVDILPMVFIGLGLYLYQKNTDNIFWLPMLGVLAVLTKFQAIVFAPLFFALALKDVRRMLLGFIPATLAAVLVLLPFIMSDVLLSTLNRAYFANLSIYPYSTLNAANFWYLLGQNRSPDNLVVFLWESVNAGFWKFLTVKTIGMSIFVATSLVVFYRALRARSPDIYQACLILLVMFFVFAPGMHERYFFPAVVIGAMAASADKKYFILYLVITVLTFLNIQLVHAVQGEGAWVIASWGFVLLVPWVLWYSLSDCLNNAVYAQLRKVKGCLLAYTDEKSVYLYVFALAFVFLNPMFTMWRQSLIMAVAQDSGFVRLTDLEPVSVYQAWGLKRDNLSVDGNPLRAAGKVYTNGIGTHARSVIVYKIPEGAKGFTALVAIDDETAGGSVKFSVLVDGRVKWSSGLLKQGNIAHVTGLEFKGEDNKLTLLVDPQGSNNGDHADWLEPRFIFD